MPAASTRHIEPLLPSPDLPPTLSRRAYRPNEIARSYHRSRNRQRAQPVPRATWTFSRSITINHQKVGASDLANFPVLVAGIYPWLRTVANGGDVQSSSGADIAFFSDPQCTQALDFEIERWNATTGEVAYWVRLPAVFTAVDTVFYIAYGNTTVGRLDNPRGVWDSGFRLVQHLGDGTTLDLTDSTGHFGSVNHGAVAAVGQVAGGSNATASAYYEATAAYNIINGGPNTHCVRMWVKGSSFGGQPIIWAMFDAVIGDAGVETSTTGTQLLWFYRTSPAVNFRTVNMDISDGQWHLLHFVKTGFGDLGVAYIDGKAAVTASGTLNSTPASANSPIGFGHYSAANPFSWPGSLDEVRISNVVRTADWVLTEFNNESNPATFYYIDLMPSERKTFRSKQRRLPTPRQRRPRAEVFIAPSAPPLAPDFIQQPRVPRPMRTRRLRSAKPIPSQPNLAPDDVFGQPRRTRTGRTARRHAIEVTPPQFNPPFPFVELVQPKRLRGLLSRRARRFESPIAQAAPTPPTFPLGANQPRRLRGLGRVKRNPSAFPLEQLVPIESRSRRWRVARNKNRRPSEVVPTQQAPANPDFSWPTDRQARTVRGASRRRGRGAEVVQPQVAPVAPTFVAASVQPRRLRSTLVRRARRSEPVVAQEAAPITGRKRTNRANLRRAERSYEVVPTQQTVVDASIMWSRDRQPRDLRGFARTRGKRTDVVQPQLNPPLPILESVQPRRPRGLTRWRGRSFVAVPGQVVAPEAEIRFAKVSRVKRLGRRQRRPGFDTFGQAIGPTSLVKTWDGLVRASVRTFDGVPNASTKTVKGLP